ncbi:protein-methionine-sulfoxide reductase heme-binding subunit MsrQ [Octadecabacter sp. G9-8]|uniref:Protein-methionine-sulfoxide reductase heme-binding subunit MsrQ n=1 Tax=Octadecabacter dasysiphoniae TaxID=2909341 RepID=A0ABS9CVF6_9RHOB|nr:protein-methionine-sulfoxide reductase heme-binding subunit MsrQ [Octadecabacter dasysiphoniae]MCF2871242.1 protein-methionine-sulfoxide reductase heme-binding subunit MsrQ [Octadecabacter dasysiphoniae]
MPMSALSKFVDPINSFARKVPTWLVYILYSLPIPYLFWLAQTGGMGVEPINALEREMGEITLQLLIIGLAITPARKYLGLNLLKFRRAIGVMAFFYVVVHLGIWVLLDMNLRWGQMWADIWKRPYITIGMAAFLGMIPLAVTSNNWSVRKLGAASWRKMHKLVYPIAVLGAVHFIMVQKVWEVEPLLYLTVILGLLALRYKPSQKASGVSANG